ncbi:hypothetical protein ACP70R_042430 [Stipagrostis hirtigluma subsp. patula]
MPPRRRTPSSASCPRAPPRSRASSILPTSGSCLPRGPSTLHLGSPLTS